MARHNNRSAPKIGRVLLLLFGVFVVTSVIAIATHKGNGGAKSHLASDTVTTTTVVGASGDVKPTSTTAVGTKTQVAGSKATTTTAVVATTHVKVQPTTTTTTPPYILFNVAGTGDDSIGPFVISTPATQWNVAWTYNCSKLGKKEKFDYAVAFKHGLRPDLSDVGPNRIGLEGAGVKHYYDAGTFNLSVATACSWTIKVVEIVP